jgi:hypothetical protein
MQKQLWDSLQEQMYHITTLMPLHYRVIQAYLHASGVPYCWFTGFCSYEGKNAWLTEKASNRKFAKFAQ